MAQAAQTKETIKQNLLVNDIAHGTEETLREGELWPYLKFRELGNTVASSRQGIRPRSGHLACGIEIIYRSISRRKVDRLNEIARVKALCEIAGILLHALEVRIICHIGRMPRLMTRPCSI